MELLPLTKQKKYYKTTIFLFRIN